jgi:hypothetical protein
MAFIVKTDLHITLYPEIIDEIIRKLTLDFATQTDFPVTGVSGYIYKDLSTDNLFSWSGTSYIPATDPDTLITRFINTGIAEVKSYLSRYDTATLFAGSLDPTITEYLKTICIDVICWRMVKLSNVNIDLKLLRTGYEDAITWLKLVQQGKADPSGWPYPADDPTTKFKENEPVQWSSNCKRTQFF